MRNPLFPYNPALKQLARKLRKESTLSEVLLWVQIKNKALGVEFHRQVPIDNYIVDFYCHELKLVIEIDGVTHNDEAVHKNDEIRQAKLEAFGISFIRFNDRDVKKSMPDILQAIDEMIEQLNGR